MQVYVMTDSSERFYGVYATEERAREEVANNLHLNAYVICEEVQE